MHRFVFSAASSSCGKAQDSAVEERRKAEDQRPFAKRKAAKRHNKRTAVTTSDSVEQPVSKRQDQCLTAEFFAACARDPSEPGAAGSGSAARPASDFNAYAEPRSLQDCNDWLNIIPDQKITKSKPLQQLQSAIMVLQRGSSRQQREEVQQLLHHWDVHQKARKRKRPYEKVKAELLAKVIQETRRLKRMQVTSGTSSPHDYASTPGAPFSAIMTSLHNASAPR